MTDEPSNPQSPDALEGATGPIDLASPKPAPQVLAETPVRAEDPASRALADALRFSFRALQIAMIGVLIGYLASGYYTIDEQEAGVELLFGRISGDKENAGAYFTWPFPIGESVVVPTNDRDVSLSSDFWYEVNEESGEGQAGALNPTNDGSLITGDANVVHGRFTVTYFVDNPRDFVESVGLLAEGDPIPGQGGRIVTTPEQRMGRANELVRNIARQAIIAGVAATTADAFRKGQLESGDLASDITRRLDALGSGLSVRTVNLTQSTVPLSVEDAYQAVGQAEARRATAINAAQQEQSRVLAEVAGAAAEGLRNLLNEYDRSRTAQDSDRIAELEALINQTFDTLEMPEAYGGASIGGEVATTVNAALSYRTQVAEEVKAEADRFRTLRDQYEASPDLFRARLGWQVAQEVFTAESVQTFWLRDDALLYLETNRDPALVRRLQEAQLRAAEQEAEEQAQQRDRNAR
ncbi:MAG: SPFH domain-containing protein [Planctomycetota bacterium]